MWLPDCEQLPPCASTAAMQALSDAGVAVGLRATAAETSCTATLLQWSRLADSSGVAGIEASCTAIDTAPGRRMAARSAHALATAGVH